MTHCARNCTAQYNINKYNSLLNLKKKELQDKSYIQDFLYGL